MSKSNTHGLNSLKQKLVKTITFASIGALLAVSLVFTRQEQVQGAPSTTLNFQARLLNKNGTLVQDGYYHIRFKLYDHVSAGTQVWNESYSGALDTQRVRVVNGYFSIYLGTNDSFADESDVNWNEELYLTMEIGGSTTSASWDGEMSPRIKLTAVPFAFQAEQLAKTESVANGGERGTLGFTSLTANRNILLPDADGTVCLQNSVDCGFLTGDAGDYIQNGPGPQTDAMFNIQAPTGQVAATIQGASGQNIFVLNNSSGTPVLTVESDGDAVLAADLAVNGGDIRSTAGLNVTASNGAVVVTSTGATNDVSLVGADQVILNATSTIELLDNTNITGNLDVTGNADIDGNLIITSAASGSRVISGRFNNDFTGTSAGTYFQNSETNGNTYLNVVANGTGTTSGMFLHGTNFDYDTYGSIEYTTGTGLALSADNSLSGGGGSITLRTKPSSGTLTDRMTITQTGVTTFNPTAADADFNVQGDTNTNLFYIDASTDRIGVGTATPSALFSVGSSSQFQVDTSGNVNTSGTLDVASRAAFGSNASLSTSAALVLNHEFGSGDGCASIGCWGGLFVGRANASGANTGAIFAQALASGGTIVDMTGIFVSNSIESGGTITNGVGISVQGQTSGDNNAGIIIAQASGTNSANLIIGQTTIPTGSYSIYNASTAANFFGGSLTVDSSITSGDSNTLGSLVLHDGNGQTATIRMEDNALVANTILSIPSDVSTADEFCLLTLGNCTGADLTLQDVYDNDADGSNAVIALTAADGGVLIRDAASTVGSLFVVEANGGTDYLTVTNTGIAVGGNGTFSGNVQVDGNTTLGNASTDTITFTGHVAGDLNLVRETPHTIKIADSTTAATAGATLSILGANGNSATGGAISVIGGSGSQTNSIGGAVTVQGGQGLNGLSVGGAVNITGGNGLTGGVVNINGGSGLAPGSITMQTTDTNGSVGIGTSSPDARLELAGNKGQSAWGLNGIQLQASSATYTDNSTAASGTATNAAINSFGTPTITATNAGVTTTNAATVYIQGAPTAGTNQTITNAYSLWTGGGTVRFDSTTTNTGAGQDINMTLGNDADVDTVSGLNIDVTSAATGDADIVYGLNVGNLTGANATVLERAIRIGSGWDEAIDANGTLISLTELQALDAGISLTTEVSGILPIANGGTNASTAQGAIDNISGLTTNGDLLYHNGTNSTRLARGSDGQCLTSNATTILWGSCATGLTLQSVYDADSDGSDAVIALTAADGAVVIRDAASTVGNLFVVEANGGADYFAVTNTGIAVGGSGTFSGDVLANGGDVTSATSLNVTALSGALTLTSTGSGNDITLTSADQIFINPATTVDINGNTAVGNFGFALPSQTVALVAGGSFTSSQTCTGTSGAAGCMGVQGVAVGVSAGGTNPTLTGVFGQNAVQSGAITNSYALYAASASGAPTNNVGLYVAPMTTGTNNSGIVVGEAVSAGNDANLVLGAITIPTGDYSIYNASTDANFFAGSLTVDSSITSGDSNTLGSFILHDGNGQAATIRMENNALAANTILSIPSDVGTADEFCLLTLGNCTGSSLDGVYDLDPDKELLIDDAAGLIFDMTTTGNFTIQDSNATIANFTNAGAITFTPTSGQSFATTVAGAGTITNTISGTGNSITNLSGTGDLVVQDNGVTFATFDDGGNITFAPAGAGDFNVTLDSDSTFSMAGGNIGLNATGTGTVTIGNSTSTTSVSITSANNGEVAINSGTDGTINIGSSANSRTINIGTGGGTAQAVAIGNSASQTSVTVNAGQNGINLWTTGTSNSGVVIRTETNTATAFRIQKDDAVDTLFTADTSGNILKVGDNDTDYTMFVVDRTTSLPADGNSALNGGLIYDSTNNAFMIYENGQKKEICNMVDLGCGAGATVTLQDSYDNDSDGGGVNVTTTDADGGITWNLHNSASTDPNFVVNIATSSTSEFKVQSNSVDILQIGAAGQLQLDTQGTGGGLLIGTDAQLYRSAANTLSTGSGDALTVSGLLTGQAGATIAGTISLNDNSSSSTSINGGSGTGDVTIGNNNAGANVTINAGGTIDIGASAQARTVNLATGNNSTQQLLTMGSHNTASSTTIRAGSAGITLSSAGGILVDPTADSTNTFQIQDSAVTPDVLFTADTTNNRLQVGNSDGTVLGDYTLLVLDNVHESDLFANGSAVNGAMAYDEEAHKFKVYENGVWKTICNTTDAGCGSSGATQDLQEAYDNSATDGIIVTSSNTKDIIFRSGTQNSTTMFMLQDTSATNTLFTANTVDNIVKVGDDAGTVLDDYTLLVLDNVHESDLFANGSAVNGAMAYDEEAHKLKVYENGVWKTVCNQTDLGCGSAGVSQTLQDAYNNSPGTGGPLITTTSATKNLIFKSGTDSTEMFELQDASGAKLFVADTDNFRVSIGSNAVPANSVLTVGTNSAGSDGGIYFGTDTNLYRSASGVLRTDGSLQLGQGADRTFDVQGRTTDGDGYGLTISAGDAGSSGTAYGGGDLVMQGGDAAGSTGDASGGDIILNGGSGVNNGARGLVVISTPTFTTTVNDANCYTGGALVSDDCTVTMSSVNNSSAVIVGFDEEGHTATLPNPTNLTPGRIIYITGADASSDFTLIVNAGGQGNEIAMKANTSATMIWNGDDWTAAGASSSTTLQAAYNNTLTSAGGAEIVLNNTSSANGLTIRNNASSPITGGLLEVQSSVGTNLFSVNNRGIELAANGGSETDGTWATNWQAEGSATASRTETAGEFVTGLAGAEVVTTTTADGVKNNLSGNPVASTTYQVSFTAKASSTMTNSLDVYYSPDGSEMIECVNYSTQSLTTTGWSKVTCTILTTATSVATPELIINQSDATGRTIWIDNLSFMRNDTTTDPSNVQIGGGIDGGPITLFTLDRSSAPPVDDNNEIYRGSMYYDTVTGRIQCYEADGWGACGSAPDNFVNMVPEFPGAVLNGPGVGTMTADFCSDQIGTLSVNDGLCDSGQALNFYRWTSPQASEQEYSIYVTYKLPAAFKGFMSNDTVTLMARTDNVTNGEVSYEMFSSSGGTLTQCGDETIVTSSANAWLTEPLDGDEADTISEGGCGFGTQHADTNLIFKINVRARSNANVYVGTLSFTTVGQ